MLYQCDDYRKFIRQYVNSLNSGPRGKLKEIAENIGIHPTSFSQVMKGNKSLNSEQGVALCKYLGLTQTDSQYLMNLIYLDRAGTLDAKKYYEAQAESLKRDKKNISKILNEGEEVSEYLKSIFYSSWHYSAIRILTSIEEYKTPEQIAKRLNLKIKTVNEALDFLVKNKLCIEENGKYSPGPAHTHLSANSKFISNHRINWRLKCIEKLKIISEEEISFVCPVTLSKASYEQLASKIRGLIKEALDTALDSEAEDLYCLNIDWLKI